MSVTAPPYPTWLEFLNHYSNLLLVILSLASVVTTIVYVVLTRQNLVAFQRSIRREREAKHLDDVREHVVSPIVGWIDVVFATLSGVGSYHLIKLQRSDTSPREPWQICSTTFPIVEFHAQLYSDAVQKHFPRELTKYDSFRNVLGALLDDIAAFGRSCCEELWKATELPPPNVFDRTIPFVSFEEIVQAWLRFAVCGLEPVFFCQGGTDNARGLFMQGNPVAMATDLEENITVWLPRAFRLLDDRWKHEKLGSRVAETRRDAELLRVTMLDIHFAQNLSGDCKYLGF
jgi:hypothetical protein